MGRLGIFPNEATAFIRAARELPGLVVEGLFTHLSAADGATEWEEAYTAGQLAVFDAILADLAAAGIEIPLIHALNSAGLLRSGVRRWETGGRSQEVDAQSTLSGAPAGCGGAESKGVAAGRQMLVRCGIAVYGLDPSPPARCPADFRPALAWKTQVAQVKELPGDSFIGYGAAYRTQGAERIAVIPVGYADGFRRGPQHWGEVLVRGQRAPVVGRVCMDQTMINVTHIPGIRLGDEVVLIGAQGAERISAEAVAERLGTINYEVVSAILARVPRETIA
jgi:alanine racemase